MRCRQVCRQHGEMESKLNHGSAGLGWNPWAGYSISLTSVSFFKVTKVLCDFFNSLEAHEEHRASGLLWNSIFTSLGALLSSALESAVQISVTSMRCLQRRDHILVTEINNAAIGGRTWTDWFLLDLRFSSPILFLNLWCLVEEHIWRSMLYF